MLLSYTEVANVFQFRMNPDGSCFCTVIAVNSFCRACTCVSRGDISVVPGNCITSYEMSAERVILNPSFFVTKP